MTFEDYQEFTKETAIYPKAGEGNLIYPTLGLCGEAGEFAEHVKKMIRDDGGTMSPDRAAKAILELGDVLYYWARCCTELGVSAAAVAGLNMSKLRERKVSGTLHGDGDNR